MSIANNISSRPLRVILTLGNSSKKRDREGQVMSRSDKQKVQKLEEVQDLQEHKIDYASSLPFDVWCRVFTYLKPEDLYQSKTIKEFIYNDEKDAYYLEKRQIDSLETISSLFKFYLDEFKNHPFWKCQCREAFRETVLSLPAQRKLEINWYDFYRQELLKHRYLISDILRQPELPVEFKDDTHEHKETVKSVEGYLYFLNTIHLVIQQMNAKDINNSNKITVHLPEKYKYYNFENIYVVDKKIYLIATLKDEEGDKRTSVFEYCKEALLKQMTFDNSSEYLGEEYRDDQENEGSDLKTITNDPNQIYELPLNVTSIYKQSHLLICVAHGSTSTLYILDFNTKSKISFAKPSHLVYVAIIENQLVLWNVQTDSFIRIGTNEITNIKFNELDVELSPFACQACQNIFLTCVERSFFENKTDNLDLAAVERGISKLADHPFLQSTDDEVYDNKQSMLIDQAQDEDLASEQEINPVTPIISEIKRTYIDIYNSTTLKKIYQISSSISPRDINTIIYDNKLYCFKKAQLIHIVDLALEIELTFETNYELVKYDLTESSLYNFNLVDGLYFFSNYTSRYVLDLRTTQYYIIQSQCRYNQHPFSTKYLARTENYLLVGENCMSKSMNYVKLTVPELIEKVADEELPDTQPYEVEE